MINLISGPILVRLAQICFAIFHRIKFQGKPLIQTQENTEKPHFGPDLRPVAQNSGVVNH